MLCIEQTFIIILYDGTVLLSIPYHYDNATSCPVLNTVLELILDNCHGSIIIMNNEFLWVTGLDEAI